MRPTPPGFNKGEVVKGLRLAMNFGAPNAESDRVTFCWVTQDAAAGVDDAGVPFDPTARTTRRTTKVRVPCAVDYADAAESGGRVKIDQTRIVITVIEPDWSKVKPFEYVVWGGDKYVRRTSTVVALGSIDVWTITCRAEDES